MSEAPRSIHRAWLTREKQRLDEQYKDLCKRVGQRTADIWYKRQQIDLVTRSYDMVRRAQGFDETATP